MVINWKRSMKVLKIVFIVLLSIVMAYFVGGELLLPQDSPGFAYYLEKYKTGWTYRLENGETGSITVPGKCDVEPKEIVYFENTLPEEIPPLATCITFRSARQDLEIYIDGELRNTYNTEDTRLFDKNSAVATIITPIDEEDAGKSIVIKTTSDSVYNGRIVEVNIANQVGLLYFYLEKNGMIILFAILAFLLSVMSIVVSYVMLFVYKRRVTLGYLGFGVMLGAIWIMANSTLRQFMWGNISVVGDLAFLIILILPYPFVIYLNDIQKGRYAKWYTWILGIVTLNFPISVGLHMAKLVDFSRSISVSAGICIITISILVGTLINDAVKGYIKEYSMIAIGISFAFLCGMVQIVAYFFYNDEFNGFILSLGLIILLFVSAVDSVRRLILTENEKKSAIIAGKAKSRFLANMSHEIRTPINAVLGMNEMILRESKEPAIREYAVDIRSAGNSLLSIINDILDMSKIESGKMELVKVEYHFSEMIHDVVNLISDRAKKKNLRFKLEIDEDIPEILYGDDVRIKQILVNLCSNAVKYTEIGEVVLRINARMIEDYIFLYVEVTDTGIGIKEEDVEKLFSAFERIEESRNRNIEGTGLGMNITMELLELMNSKLEVESTYGKGSRFGFKLMQRIVDFEPVGDIHKRIREMAKQTGYHCSFRAPTARILVVDDNEINRKVFVNLLKETGIVIHEVDNGEDCLSSVCQHYYDMIFLDHMMPGLDGIETLKWMKRLEERKNLEPIVIALTANAIAGAREKYLQEGFQDYLPKPIHMDKLEEMMLSYLPKEKIEFLEVIQQEESVQIQEDVARQMEELRSIPQLNLDYAAIFNPNEETLLQVMQDFAVGMKAEADLLDRLLANAVEEQYSPKTLKAYRIQVHSMKSSAALVGAIGPHALAKILEDAAREQEIEIIKNLHPVFIKNWRKLQQELQPFVQHGDNSKGELKAFAREEILSQIEELEKALDSMDVDKADDIASQLNAYQYPENWIAIMERIYKATRDLEAQEVEACLKELKEDGTAMEA